MEGEGLHLLDLPTTILGQIIRCLMKVNPSMYLRDWFAVVRTCKKLNACALSRHGLFQELARNDDRPLRRAAQIGAHSYMVRLLDVLGPRASKQNVRRALVVSAERGFDECVRVLCERGNSFLNAGTLKRALWFAVDRGDYRCASVLLRHTEPTDQVLILALKKKHLVSLLYYHATENSFSPWYQEELSFLPTATRALATQAAAAAKQATEEPLDEITL